MRFLAISAAIILGLAANSYAAVLWYNGDFDGRNGLSNEINTNVTQANIYDDFNAASDWTINNIWSNNMMTFTGVTQALWEIRSGVSAGDGGTIFASGTSAASQTATGRTNGTYYEYRIEVSGLSISLPAGTYWLTVAPVGFGSGRAYNSTTSGLNAIGTPAGNNGNSFFDSSWWGADFLPVSDMSVLGPDTWDFSMGIGGSSGVIPEPATMTLLGMGMLGLAIRRRSRVTRDVGRRT